MKNKKKVLVYPFMVLGLLLFLMYSCKKKDQAAPALITSSVSDITKTTAIGGGLITSDGVEDITERGVCWGTGETPTINDSKSVGIAAVNYKAEINGLSAGTTYYVRAYATNSQGTGYGDAISFTTLPPEEPVLTTAEISDITKTTATSGGNVTDGGGVEVTARGVCWSTGPTPTIDDSKTTDGSGSGNFTSALTDLTPGTTYYVRAYATNNKGTGYGNVKSFTTKAPPGAPILSTSVITDITQTTATSGGNITDIGGGEVTARGVCWGITKDPTIADSKTTDGVGTGTFISNMKDLSAGATYFVRAYATNSIGTGYGENVTFRTVPALIGNKDNGTLPDNPATTICENRYQCTVNMTVTKMYAYVATSGTGAIKMAIYDDSNKMPNNLLMSTNELTNPGTGWVSFDLTSPLALTSGNWYHIALWTDNTGYAIFTTAGGSTPYLKGMAYGPWPNPSGPSSPWVGGEYCMYAQ